MSICDGCIHDDVCGLEDNHEEGIVSCSDRIPKDVLDKVRAEIEAIDDIEVILGGEYVSLYDVSEIIDKYRSEVSKE